MHFDYASMGFHALDCLWSPSGEYPAGSGAVLPDGAARAVSAAAGVAAINGAKVDFDQIMKFRNTNPVLAPALEEAAG